MRFEFQKRRVFLLCASVWPLASLSILLPSRISSNAQAEAGDQVVGRSEGADRNCKTLAAARSIHSSSKLIS